MSSSSTLIHACSRVSEVCNCGYTIERFSATWREERWRKSRRMISDLPEEVLTEVLLRLPVKALIRFKCVCKFWYDLITSPSFISMHYTVNHSKNEVSLYCHSYDRCDRTIFFRFSDTPVDLNPRICVEMPEIVGSSYGLVCISPNSRWHSKFIIWNPATRDSRIVYVSHSKEPGAWIYCGFWYDGSIAANTHKLVRITIYPYRETTWEEHLRGRTRVGLHIFTLSANSWRVKELALPYKLPREGTKLGSVTCVGRCMYWVLDVLSEKHLLCFDMADELFQRIELPCFDHGACSTALHEYKGSLAILVWERAASVSAMRSFDMWLLNDFDGVKQSWSKQLTLRPPFLDALFPIGFFMEDGVGVMALYTDAGYFLWNPDSGKTRMLWERGYVNVTDRSGSYYSIIPLLRESCSQLFRYCESLASVY